MWVVAAALESQFVLKSFEASDALVKQAVNLLARQRLLVAVTELQGAMLQGAGTGSIGPTPGSEALDWFNPDSEHGPPNSAKPSFASSHISDESLGRLRISFAADAQKAFLSQPTLEKHRLVWERRAYVLLLITDNLAVLLLCCGSLFTLLYLHSHADNWRSLDKAREAVLGAERNRANFLAAAGHDLRQPLQATSLFVSALLQRELDSETRALGRKIDGAIGSMRGMINGLLDAAKLDAGLVAADKRDVPLQSLFRSFHDEFARLAQAASLELVVEPTSAVVYTDPVLLDAILRNLLSNAIKYTPAGSVRLATRQGAGDVVIEVADTGIGIAADKLGTIFQDFCRVAYSNAEGLGLGLGIVRRLAGLLGIAVTVRSAMGAGSTFSLAVTASTSALPGSDSEPPATRAPTTRLKTLLVDDDDSVRDGLVGQLECWDLDVIQATSGAQARTLLQSSDGRAFDLVIVDYNLGDTTGLSLLDEIERARGERPYGIVITGSSSEPDLQRLRASIYPWLRKPLDIAALQREVDRLAAKAAERAQLKNLIQSF